MDRDITVSGHGVLDDDSDRGLDFGERSCGVPGFRCGSVELQVDSMTDSQDDVAELPDSLPPVEPPSAGFILQLFVIPGLIVAVIIGIWWLFGKMASGEQDWQSLVIELQHPNPQRRWRGAHGLAQILRADQDRKDGQRLAENGEIAKALADTLSSELKQGSTEDDDLKYQAFLARTLGMFNLPDAVLPVLRTATQANNDREVRKNALAAIATIGSRLDEKGTAIESPPLIDDLVEASHDQDPLIRQLSSFTLGIFDSPVARDRLAVLLDDSDKDTQINAAIGLARHQDLRCLPTLKRVLEALPPKQATNDQAYEQFVTLKNVLKAVEQLAPELKPDDRQQFTQLVKAFGASTRDPSLRVSAESALRELEPASENP